MNTMIRWNPFGEMARMRNEIDRLFEDAFNAPAGKWERNAVWGFPLDVTENDDTFTVKAAVPGMNPDDLDITISDSVLTIKGEMKEDKEIKEETYHLRERRFGQFTRSVTLPMPVNADRFLTKSAIVLPACTALLTAVSPAGVWPRREFT